MEVETLTLPRDQIKQELATLKKGINEGYISRRSKIVRDLMAIYGHMSERGKMIDVYESFKKAGLTKDGHPRLAIVRADSSWCHLFKRKHGGAVFSNARKNWYSVSRKEGDVELPTGHYGDNWYKLDGHKGERNWRTLTPVIPPRISVAVSARIIPYHYHILFEAEQWISDPEPPQPPRDPILGRMITKNIFAVYASWDLTELERKVILGNL